MQQTPREYEHLSESDLIHQLWLIWKEDLSDICEEACSNSRDAKKILFLQISNEMLKELKTQITE